MFLDCASWDLIEQFQLEKLCDTDSLLQDSTIHNVGRGGLFRYFLSCRKTESQEGRILDWHSPWCVGFPDARNFGTYSLKWHCPSKVSWKLVHYLPTALIPDCSTSKVIAKPVSRILPFLFPSMKTIRGGCAAEVNQYWQAKEINIWDCMCL